MTNEQNIGLGSRSLEIIKLLYYNNRLTQGEISHLLGNTASATANLIKKIIEYNALLLHKEVQGKYRYYTLTKYGRQFYESYINHQNIPNNNLKNEFPLLVSESLAKILVANILNNIDPSNQDFLVQGLKNLSVDTITSKFSLSEFLFLCLILGIITKPMTGLDACKLIMPEVPLEEAVEIGRITYKKLKSIIIEEIIDIQEENIFNGIDRKS